MANASRRTFIQGAALGAVALGSAAAIARAEEAPAPESYASFFQIPMGQNTAEQALDKANIRELVEYERYCRDYKHYEEMRACYAEDSTVTVSWMEGTGNEFVDGTIARFANSSAVGGHKIFNTVVWLNGDKAIAEIIAVIIARFEYNGVEYDAPAYSRMLYRVERIDGVWKINRFESVYEFDSITKSFPVPAEDFDPTLFEGLRSSYKGISFIQVFTGREPNNNLPGDDEPATIEAMYQAASDWLFA